MLAGALSGLRAVELGHGVSAPYCARLFADYGADVVKVEPPDGDPARAWGPFPNDEPQREKSGLFHFLNTNKRGVVLDTNTRRGRDALLELIAGSDVLIENRRPAEMRQWGLDYASLAPLNPNLVMISITPFGQTGPYSSWNAYDLNAYHLTGASSRYCGRPGEMPLEHGTFAADFFGAVTGAAWGLAAVLGRGRAGGGQHLDVSSAEAIAATYVGAQNIGAYAQDGVYDKRTGVGMSLAAPATIMPCLDGHVWLLAIEPGQWNGLRRAMGDPDWARADLFQDMFARAENRDLIYAMVGEWASRHRKLDIMERCQAEGCPVTAVFTVAEAAEHPHLAERGYLVEIDDPDLGRYRTLGAPFKLPACPGGPSRPAPRLGEHDREVLGSAAAPVARLGLRGSPARDALPLAGLKVANFGWVWAGPVVGQTLAFLGADVYKVESHTRVDMMRTLPPFAGGERSPDRSLSNHACWAGNRSVSLDLKRDAARELALALVAECDVVIENFGPGVMERFGLGYEAARRARPDIVYFSMPAAGLYGPMRDVRTYGLSLASTTGLDSLVGYEGGAPIPVENAFADPYNGIFGAFAILTALAHREQTGEGQWIDYSQQEAVMQLVGPAFMDYTLNGRVAGPIGNRHPLNAAAPHGVFPCAGEDRWISLAAASEDEWHALVAAMDDPAWTASAKFRSQTARLRNISELHRRIAEWTRGFGDRALCETLQARGVAAAPVLDVRDLLHDEHFRARGTFVEVRHPLGFLETIYGAYVKTSRTRARVSPGPAIGQDNEPVLKGLLGLSDARYDELVREGVID